jgi:hypothetical protein
MTIIPNTFNISALSQVMSTAVAAVLQRTVGVIIDVGRITLVVWKGTYKLQFVNYQRNET